MADFYGHAFALGIATLGYIMAVIYGQSEFQSLMNTMAIISGLWMLRGVIDRRKHD
jgi:hypothetical protein